MKQVILWLLLVLLISLQSYAQQWVNTNPNFSTETVKKIKFKNEQVGFLLFGYDLWRTTDAGESFSFIDSSGRFFEIYIFGDTILAAGRNNILRSTDDFNTFDVLKYNFEPEFIPTGSFFLNPDWLIVTMSGYNDIIQRSTNGGLTWFPITLPHRYIRGIYFSDPLNGIYASTRQQSPCWRTTDGGSTWTTILPDVYRVSDFFQKDNTIVMRIQSGLGTYPSLIVSTDYGYNWQYSPSSFYKYLIKDSFIIGYWHERPLFITYDNGLTWDELPSPTSETWSLDVVNDSIYYVGSVSGSIYKSLNKGNDWNCITSPAFPFLSISVPERGVVFAGGDNLMRTFDNGLSWEVIYGQGIFNVMHFKDRSTGFAALLDYDFDTCYFVKTTDSGNTWDTLYNFQYSIYGRIKKIYFKDEANGFVVGLDHYFRTTDGGDTWNFNSSPGGNDINFLSADRGYIASNTGGYSTTDGGDTWMHSPKYEGSTIFFVDTLTGFRGIDWALQKTTDGGNTYFDLINHGQFDSWRDIYFWGRDTGIAHFEYHEVIKITTNCGSSWGTLHQHGSSSTFRMKFLSPTYGWTAASNGGHLMRYDIGIPLGETDEGIHSVKEYYLEQNFPNPFNPVTQIRYSLAEQSRVELIIYDILGREIERLVSEEQEPGEYKAAWNASAYTSGIYICLLNAGSYKQGMKMMLVK